MPDLELTRFLAIGGSAVVSACDVESVDQFESAVMQAVPRRPNLPNFILFMIFKFNLGVFGEIWGTCEVGRDF